MAGQARMLPLGTRFGPFVALLSVLSVAGTWNAWGQEGPEYDLFVDRNVMVAMRDGVRLATDLYFPAVDGNPAPGKFPALVQRIAYGKSGSGRRANAEVFARNGYVVVFQDVRGRFDSEGSFYPYVNEGPDGYDTVEWIRAQAWSDGRIGTFGSSYTAGAAHALAAMQPEGVRALFITMGASNYKEDAAGYGGAVQLLHNLGWAAAHADDELAGTDSPKLRVLESVFDNYLDWLRAPAESHLLPLSVMPEFAEFYRDWLEHADYDEYWKQNGYNVEEFYDRLAGVPVFYLGGWYDIFLRGTLANYTGLARGNQQRIRLVVGPWTHGGGRGGANFASQVDFGPESARPSGVELQLGWFGHWLKGQGSGVLNDPPVRIFVMGGGDGHRTSDGRIFHGGTWRFESEWPLARMTPVNYYLHAGGGLSPARPSSSDPSAYQFDPRDPVPTVGGNMTHGRDVAPMGPADQRCRPEYPHCRQNLPLAARRDVIVFQTEPLEEPIEVTGPITVRFWASSSATDTDFTAKLIDVYPRSPDYPLGFAMNLADGVIRARYRNSLERAEFMEPGRPYEFEIDLWATSNVFQRGHRIRLDISSSNFPRFDVNPNTGEKIGFQTRQVVAYNRLYHGPEHPSHIVLPIIPARTAADAARGSR